MDDFNQHTNPLNNHTQDTERTPYQTPVRGANESSGSAGQGQTYGGAYEQWSGSSKKQKKPPKPKKPGSGRWKWVVGLVAVAALAFGGGIAVSHIDFSAGNAAADSAASSSTGSRDIPADSATVPISDSNEDMASYSAVYEKVSPSIVSVVVDSIQTGASGSGSGVIMSEDGYIITNNHVVEGADKYSVVLSDSSSYDAELIGTDEQTDLAVLKVDKTGLSTAEFGDSDSLKVGDRAFAIGSPGGVEFQNSFTGGFISAINRNVTINDRVMNLIQTDTAINPGNSGGALINASGQVIGITSSKLSGSTLSGTSIEGMGFAIPTSTVKEVVDQLIAYGHVTGRPAIGISGYDISETRAAYYDVPQGVLVSGVDSNSDAAAQGIKSGDIITGVNGKDITCMNDINAIKQELSAGDSMKLTIYRSGKTLDITIALIDEADLAGDSNAQTATDESQDNSGYSFPFGYGYGYSVP